MIALVGLVAMISCSKDKDCDNLSTNIVGKWELGFDNSIVEFKSDGTLVDQNDGLIGGEFNGSILSMKTYTVEGSDLKIRAEEANGGQFLSTSFEVTESTCDEITFSFLGIPVKMTRQ